MENYKYTLLYNINYFYTRCFPLQVQFSIRQLYDNIKADHTETAMVSSVVEMNEK